MTTLNERASKCMGDEWRNKRGYKFREFDPANSLDDAARVEAEAIRRHGWDAYFSELCAVCGVPLPLLWSGPVPSWIKIITTATAEQRCLAAVRLMEQRR